jgi:hypothetical protein
MTRSTTRTRKYTPRPRSRALADGMVKSIRFPLDMIDEIEKHRPEDVDFSGVVRQAMRWWLDQKKG